MRQSRERGEEGGREGGREGELASVACPDCLVHLLYSRTCSRVPKIKAKKVLFNAEAGGKGSRCSKLRA
jgi:hypothetical protein